MEHQLADLPYGKKTLSPHMSEETLHYHHDKHHRAYVVKLNELIKGSPFEDMTLEEIIKNSEGPLFNNAAQHWNHAFFWNCMGPGQGGYPSGKIGDMIHREWGSFEKFKEDFTKAAVSHFGSGWTWLIENHQGHLEIISTSNADNPLKHNLKAIMTLDIWEHAYYIDYRNLRADFIQAFWNVVNWDFINKNLQ